MKKFLIVLVLVLALLSVTGYAVSAAPEQNGQGTVHYVAFGDTLTSIAARYGVPVDAILRANGLANPHMIYIGQPLIIPGYSSYGYGSPGGYGCSNHHIVGEGDTLYSIAAHYGTTVHELIRLNSLASQDIIWIGQKLCVPNTGGYAPASYLPIPGDAYYHTVASGETLSGICDRYQIDVWSVAEANNLSYAHHIRPGQKIYIPGYQPVAVPAPPKHVYHPPVKPPHPPKAKHKPNPKPVPPALYLRLGRNVGYEEWGRPKLGLSDCTFNVFNDSEPVQRFTAEVILTNNSKHTIPSDWASSENVKFHLQNGETRHACKYQLDKDWVEMLFFDLPHEEGVEVRDPSKVTINLPDAGGIFPGSLEPDETVDVTFYTHLEKGNIVTKMEFVSLGLCFDPNSGDRVLCDEKHY